jgi:predicted O-linked N-acetylglucosamine transferase (SPINDLY family)
MADVTRAATLLKGGERAAAEQELLSLLAASPADPTALKFLGEIYTAAGRQAEALAVWRRLTAAAPQDAAAWRQFAQSLLAGGAVAQAIESLERAIALEPQNARAHNNVGLAKLRAGDPAGAAVSLARALTIDPGYAVAHMNLGLALARAGRPADARGSLQRALELDPHLTHARIHLSELLRASDSAQADRERDKALESLAINLMTTRRHEEAIVAWTRLIDSGADVHYARGTRFHCRLHCCDWSRYAETAAEIEAAVRAGEPIDLPFSFFVHSSSAEAQLECARIYVADRHPPQAAAANAAASRSSKAGESAATQAPDASLVAEDAAAPAAPAQGLPPPQDSPAPRVKVAYLSFDFQEHATAYLVAGLFEAHDRNRFEIFALSYGPNDDSPMRKRLAASVEHFIDVGARSDAEIVALLRSLHVDIAVDLKGFTGAARTGVFAARAAPLQVNFLGYPGTMGAPYIDYLVADAQVIPADHHPFYSERVITLPHCYQPNDRRRPLPTQGPDRAHYGLPAQGLVFCCFNNLYKITPDVFDVWMSLLRDVEGSVLWLLEGTPSGMRNLRTAAQAHGIAPERLIFAPHIDLAQHLARYRYADLFLDTLPCNAHTTASDALWMAVPLLTVTGTTFAGRVATSLLHAVGLPQLCTGSLAQYAAEALRLANAPTELAALKGHLERGRGHFPLFDTAGYCAHLEAAYEEIWARHRRGEAPSALSVVGNDYPGSESERPAHHEQ